MIFILVATQASIANHLIYAAVQDMGKQENIAGVEREEDEPLEIFISKLEGALRQAVPDSRSCDGVLILTDLFGSTPTNAALHQIEKNRSPMEVVTGANLPMLLSALANRHKLGLAELAKKALLDGQRGIKNASDFKSFLK